MKKIEKLYASLKTVFTIADLRILWQEPHANALKSSVKYFVDTGSLLRLRKGVYALGAEYDHLELAQKLIVPSYISLHTALAKHGIIFQYYSSISAIASYTKVITIHEQEYRYHRIKEEILLNPTGITEERNYVLASPERAIGDWIYLYGPSYFDNLRSINKNLLEEVAEIYKQKSTQKYIQKLCSLL